MLHQALFIGIAVSLLGSASLDAQMQPEQPQNSGKTVYSGTAGKVTFQPPRLDGEAVIDGNLTDSAWGRAALLTGFSQFQPNDGRPALDSTEVLVWYSPHAIYFGIRAFEIHGRVHATLADRDKISSDDYIQILLDTFNDQRRAIVFGVNPLGVQQDGNITEGLQAKGGAAAISQSGSSVRDTADLSADYTFQSKGRVVENGYEVEVRIPFKSIRYQSTKVQTWGINVIRKVQHSGHEDSWTPARRANASFLSQSGKLVGLAGLQRGLVMDLNPFVTSKVTGTPATVGWNYDTSRPEFGGNVRWGITNNLTLNGTANPDFSQVEADVQQVSFEPRNALFYPEKRPFFLEGIETFSSPIPLIYTRQVVQPVAAGKLTGKIGSTTVGFLSAADDRVQSLTGQDNPVYNLLRVRQDLGQQSSAGVVFTDKEDGGSYNRVVAFDTRFVFKKLYALTLQGATSNTRLGPTGATSGPAMVGTFERSGRKFSFRYNFQAYHPEFHAASGFIARENYAVVNFGHNFNFYGKPGALIENVNLSVPVSVNWSRYDNLFHGGPMADIKNDNGISVRFRGGWNVGFIFFPESFKYDPDLYASYAIERHQGAVVDTIPYTGTDRLTNWDIGSSITTPQFKKFDAFLSVLTGQDENFYEWSSAWVWYVTANANFRPTPKIRISAGYQRQQFIRMSDWSQVGIRHIPRLKIEYQVIRPIFIRLVAQYDIQSRDSLRDDSRTNDPVLIRNAATGVYQRAGILERNNLRMDWLFSYQPNPGTVIFLGYGSSMTETDPLRFQDLHRTGDGFFIKLSYLFKI